MKKNLAIPSSSFLNKLRIFCNFSILKKLNLIFGFLVKFWVKFWCDMIWLFIDRKWPPRGVTEVTKHPKLSRTKIPLKILPGIRKSSLKFSKLKNCKKFSVYSKTRLMGSLNFFSKISKIIYNNLHLKWFQNISHFKSWFWPILEHWPLI